MAVHADRTDHLLVWLEIPILIVHDFNVPTCRLNTGHMACRAAHTGADLQFTRKVLLPKFVVRGREIRLGVLIAMACQTGID